MMWIYTVLLHLIGTYIVVDVKKGYKANKIFFKLYFMHSMVVRFFCALCAIHTVKKSLIRSHFVTGRDIDAMPMARRDTATR